MDAVEAPNDRWCGAMTGVVGAGLALATLALVAAMAWRVRRGRA